MLKGKNVNLVIVEKEDLPLVAEYENDPQFWGELAVYPLQQKSKADLEKEYDRRPPGENWFFIEKKDGTRIGTIFHFLEGKFLEIGYAIVQSERRKGYCTEALEIMVNYLFLSKEIMRIQAHTDLKNVASQRILDKAGFKKEGIIRSYAFVSGQCRDALLYSIVRKEWKETETLTETTSET